MTSTAQQGQGRARVSPPWRTDVAAIVAAVVCAMVMWTCTVLLADTQLIVRLGGETQVVGGGTVGVVAGMSALVGLTVLRVLEQVVPRGLEVWTALAVVTTLVSLLGPLSAASGSTAGTLAGLHGVVAAVVIASGLTSRRRRRAAI